MTDTPLNPDALEAAADAVIDASFGQELPEAPIDLATAAVSAYLAAALPEVTSVEELDQLPVGSVILTLEQNIVGQSWNVAGNKLWCFPGNTDMHEADEDMIPARVLYRPEVKP